MMATFASRRSYADSIMSNSQLDDIDSSLEVTASSSGDTINSTIETLPRTPQGLRGRKTASVIRRELGLPRRQLDRQLDRLPPLATRGYQGALGERTSLSRPMLPPMPLSTSKGSPQVSTSSFYAHSSDSGEEVARSPSLVSGQARTAVGALVANSQHSFHGTESSIFSSASALPGRYWAENQSHGMSKSMNDINSEYESMASQKILPTLQKSGEESFSHASPSSDYHRNATLDRIPASNLETSFSRSFIADIIPKSLDNIHGNGYTVPAQELNVSGISQSTKDIESQIEYGIDDEIFSHYDDMIGSDRQDFNSHGFGKIQGQRFDRDDLLFSMIERLQDDTFLVQEIRQACAHTASLPSFSSLNSASGNFFTGFDKQTRDGICSMVEDIIRKRPSTFRRISQQQDNFEHALRFVASLVRISIPGSEKKISIQPTSEIRQEGHWRCAAGFRSSIGLAEEPKSPDTIRGGDTSLFSLPSRSATATTPHTSNVSVTTTITSAFSPDKPEGTQNKQLRNTLETIVMVFDKLGHCCERLTRESFASSNIAMRVAEEITRIYLQIHTISVGNLETLVDAFVLDMLSPWPAEHGSSQTMEPSLKLPSTLTDQASRKVGDSSYSLPGPESMVENKTIQQSRDDEGLAPQQILGRTRDVCNIESPTKEGEHTPQPVNKVEDKTRDGPPASINEAPAARNTEKKKDRRVRLWRRRLIPKRRTAE